jgi:hypothetical protein
MLNIAQSDAMHTTECRVIQERPGNHEFVCGAQLADVSHVLFPKLFARLFAQLGSIGRNDSTVEVVGGLGIRLVLGLRESRAYNRETGLASAARIWGIRMSRT